MSKPGMPTLDEASRRNPGIVPDRVRKMLEVVKTLQDRGLLKPTKYGIRAPLASHQLSSATGTAARRGGASDVDE